MRDAIRKLSLLRLPRWNIKAPMLFNWHPYVQASNAKLVKRALRLTMLASGADEAAASAALAASGSRVKLAIVMLKAGLGAEAAQARLEAAGGSIEAALHP